MANAAAVTNNHASQTLNSCKRFSFQSGKDHESSKPEFHEQICQQEVAEVNRQAQEKRKVNIQILGVGAFIPFFFGILILFSKWEKNVKSSGFWYSSVFMVH